MIDQISPQDLQDAQDLLSELFTEVKAEEGTLAGGTKLDIGATALQALRETKATLGNPRNDLIQLTPKLFKDIGIELNEPHKQQMRDQFDFYYMTLTVSAQIEHGVQFGRMQCRLDFGPKGSSEPIVQTIFPKSEWKEVLGLGGGMSLALNGNLDWSAGVDIPATAYIPNLP